MLRLTAACGLEQVFAFQFVPLPVAMRPEAEEAVATKLGESPKDLSRNLSSTETQCPTLIFAVKSG